MTMIAETRTVAPKADWRLADLLAALRTAFRRTPRPRPYVNPEHLLERERQIELMRRNVDRLLF